MAVKRLLLAAAMGLMIIFASGAFLVLLIAITARPRPLTIFSSVAVLAASAWFLRSLARWYGR